MMGMKRRKKRKRNISFSKSYVWRHRGFETGGQEVVKNFSFVFLYASRGAVRNVRGHEARNLFIRKRTRSVDNKVWKDDDELNRVGVKMRKVVP